MIESVVNTKTNDISIRGPWSITETTMTFDLTCPESGSADFSVSADANTVQLQRPGEAIGVAFMGIYTFERVDN